MRLRPLFASSLLLALAACGGGSGAAPTATTAPAKPATGLTYADPTSSGWRLVKDPSSTSARLVLNLVGPSGVATRGVGFNLQGSAGVKFDAFANHLPIQDTGVYELQSAGGANEPIALAGGVKKGNLLSVGVYQKDRAMSAKDSGTALLQIALVLDPARPLNAGDKPALAIVKAKAIPADIGAISDDQWTLDQKLRMTDLTVAVGTLTAN